VAQFLDEKCTVGPEHLITSHQLYSSYDRWAKDSGIKRTLNRKNFTTRLARVGIEKEKGTAGVRMLAGVDLR
jgi:phage/plasmid-associated DNA primase